MKSKESKVSVGDLLYHSVHGMCRVKEVVRQKTSDESYTLVPQISNRTSLRYMIPHQSLNESGFRTPVTIDEAGEILDFFRTGKRVPIPKPYATETRTWSMAQNLLTCAKADFQFKEQRMKNELNRDAYSLVRELAFVLKITLRDTVNLIQKNLRGSSKLSPSIVSALEKAVEE